MNDAQRRKLQRCLLALPVAFAVLLSRACAASGGMLPSFAQFAYLSQLALLLGSLVAMSLGALTLLDGWAPGRRGIGVLVGVLASAAVPVVQAAEYLSRSDAVGRRGLSALPVMLGFCVVWLSLVGFAWRYQRELTGRRWEDALACAVLLLVGGFDLALGHSQAGFVLNSYGLAVVLGCVLVAAALPPRGLRAGAAVAALGGVAVLLGLISGVVPRELVARGRFEVHRTLSSIPHLDARLGGAGASEALLAKLGARAALPCEDEVALAASSRSVPGQPRNLIFISIDTVRADDAARVVHGQPVMPALQRFVAESWSGSSAYSPYPATMMALSSAFTGLLPTRLVLAERPPPSVFGALDGARYAKIAITPKGAYFQRTPIEHFILQGAQRLSAGGARAQTRLAIDTLRQLRKAGRPHALWIHYYEPHEPYAEHAEQAFGDGPRERYWSELAFVDRHLGRLLETLRAGGWYEDSLVFVFSDHGESFGEHRHQYHHFHLYPWLIRVPFAVRVPGQTPRQFEGPVELTDVAATAFDFVGVPPSPRLDGRSLFSAPPARDRVVISEEFPVQLVSLEEHVRDGWRDPAEPFTRLRGVQRSDGYPSKISVVRGDQQLIVHRATGVEELYDLRRDPSAEHNLAFDQPAAARSLRGLLDRWLGLAASSAVCTRPSLQASVRARRP